MTALGKDPESRVHRFWREPAKKACCGAGLAAVSAGMIWQREPLWKAISSATSLPLPAAEQLWWMGAMTALAAAGCCFWEANQAYKIHKRRKHDVADMAKYRDERKITLT
ncbi:MAG: hypothetical protein WC612_03170 [Bdellovibrionales bacterium]|jgi:hypothetical protein